MAKKKINKAYIKYELDEELDQYTQIRFHTVIFEDHEVSNSITKFPVQTGFSISNHSIKNNRRINLSAMITDTQMLLSAEFHEYNAVSNSKAVFAELKRLVREAVPCVVVTNLGEYSPVIFTKFKTKQEKGMIDAMSFTLQGEEVQLATTLNGTTPNELVFTQVPEAERAAAISELRSAGFDVPDEASISTAPADLREGWSMSTISPAGLPSQVVYENTNIDNTTDEFSYDCSISPDGTVTDSETGAIIDATPSERLLNGANVFGSCLVESTVSLATTVADDYLTTAVGDLKKTIYGGLYEVLGVNGNRDFGQKLLAMGLDCFICGATATGVDSDGNTTISPDSFDTELPTVDEALTGAAKHGDSLATGVLGQASPTTITKITGSPVGSTSFFGDLL